MYDVEKILAKYFPEGEKDNAALSAVKYTLESGGKRLRPNFVLYCANMIRRIDDKIERMAVAVELLHTYSLIHDDLPAMDDDDTRRGKPSCHVAFGEATAILAGDAAQNLAFEILTDVRTADVNYFKAVNYIAKRSGVGGMVYGQILDLKGANATEDEYVKMIKLKTANMFMASAVSPAIYFGVNSQDVALLERFAENFGVLFQIADDIFDKDGWATVNRESALKIGEEAYSKAKACINSIDYEARFFTGLLDKTRGRLI